MSSGMSEDDAEKYRAEGNEHFKAKRFHNAINCYTKSLQCRPTSAVFSNRAQAFLNIKEFVFVFHLCFLTDEFLSKILRRQIPIGSVG